MRKLQTRGLDNMNPGDILIMVEKFQKDFEHMVPHHHLWPTLLTMARALEQGEQHLYEKLTTEKNHFLSAFLSASFGTTDLERRLQKDAEK